MYEIFRLPVPIVTGDFEEALHSVGKKHLHKHTNASQTPVNSVKVFMFACSFCLGCAFHADVCAIQTPAGFRTAGDYLMGL